MDLVFTCLRKMLEKTVVSNLNLVRLELKVELLSFVLCI